MIWTISNRFDDRSRDIADRHYNRQKPGTPQFVPPGRCLVLRAPSALWVTSWPFAEYVKHRWGGAWVNACFRREGGDVPASEMIVAAVAATVAYWPDVPPLGMITFIDRTKVKPTIVRSRPVWGWTYMRAGFEVVGESKGGLIALQLLPERMPPPAAATHPQTSLFAPRRLPVEHDEVDGVAGDDDGGAGAGGAHVSGPLGA